MSKDISLRDKVRAIWEFLEFRPGLTVGIILLNIGAAMLEGIGIAFLVPIVKLAQSPESVDAEGGILDLFVRVYELLNVPLTLEFTIAGVALVMVSRYTTSFAAEWLKSMLQAYYMRYLRTRAFENSLHARVSYFDEEGSDEILNAIITQATYGSKMVRRTINIFRQLSLVLMYFCIALILAPSLTLGATVVIGAIVLIGQSVIESGYSVGGQVADANEQLQGEIQAGTQGIRDVKLFGMAEELFQNFRESVLNQTRSQIRLWRNQAAIGQFYDLIIALSVFGLIYVALRFSSLTLASLSVFLFAMFRLGPQVSTLSTIFYNLEGDLPHLIRTQQFIEELDDKAEPQTGDESVPARLENIEFRNVDFSYNDDEQVLEDVSFQINRDEMVAFVGASGAGKSTVISLLARLYEPDNGTINVNGIDITSFDIGDWRSTIAVVRQDPYLFNDTLRFNVTIGNRGASEAELKSACEISQVTEFLDELPDGYNTELGDEGVRLSGGQRQRIAIARAILKDAQVLLLDEATSDLDTNLEEKVHTGIESMEGSRITIVVAHRLSTVQNADRIYTMEDGRIIESGGHDELIEQGGIYADLYRVRT